MPDAPEGLVSVFYRHTQDLMVKMGKLVHKFEKHFFGMNSLKNG
jgi:hypothetical protein